MKYMVTWSVSPENHGKAIARFKEHDPIPPPGLKVLGCWIEVGGTQGFSLYETDDAATLAKLAMQWADLLNHEVVPVLTDAELAKAF
jgi:hypothetical protein